MKILYITEIFPDPQTGVGYWGGGERQFYELSVRAASMGNRVTVLTCRFPRQHERDTVRGVEVTRTGLSRNPKTGGELSSPRMVADYLLKSVRAALRIQADIIHCNAYYPVLVGRFVSAVRGTPVVSTFHDMPEAETWRTAASSWAWGTLGYLATIASLGLAPGKVITVSEQAREKIARHGREGVVVPNGVDLSLLRPRGTREPSQVLYVGRLVRYKRVDILLRAFALVAKDNSGASLVIVGDGPEREALEGMAEALGVAGRVAFRGTLPSNEAVGRVYAESSVFVLPSPIEGEGIVLKEAMGAGLAVVAVRAPGSGVTSIVKEGWNGHLVDSGTPEALAKAVTHLLTSQDERARMGANGLALAQGWGWDDVTRRVLGIYGDVLKGRPPA